MAKGEEGIIFCKISVEQDMKNQLKTLLLFQPCGGKMSE